MLRSRCSIIRITTIWHADGSAARLKRHRILLHPPTPELIELLGHLLDVARHRATFASEQMKPSKIGLAAYIDAKAALCGKTLTGKRLAELAGVSTYCISIWRRSAEYKRRVAQTVEDPCGPPHPDAPRLDF